MPDDIRPNFWAWRKWGNAFVREHGRALLYVCDLGDGWYWQYITKDGNLLDKHPYSSPADACQEADRRYYEAMLDA